MPATPLPVIGSSLQRDRIGVVSIPLVFIIAGPLQDGGEEPYAELLGFDPTPPLGLVDTGRSSKKLADGDWELTITFEGIYGEGTRGAVLEYDNSSCDEPIQTAKRYALILKDKFGPPLVDPTTKQFEGFPPTIKDAATGKRVPNPFYGTTHFYDNKPVLRVSFALRDFKDELLLNMCKIGTPFVPDGTAESIKTPEGKTWLKRCVKISNPGNCWRYEMEWILGVWSTDLYEATE
jgi:hypothetical protein